MVSQCVLDLTHPSSASCPLSLRFHSCEQIVHIRRIRLCAYGCILSVLYPFILARAVPNRSYELSKDSPFYINQQRKARDLDLADCCLNNTCSRVLASLHLRSPLSVCHPHFPCSPRSALGPGVRILHPPQAKVVEGRIRAMMEKVQSLPAGGDTAGRARVHHWDA